MTLTHSIFHSDFSGVGLMQRQSSSHLHVSDSISNHSQEIKMLNKMQEEINVV